MDKDPCSLPCVTFRFDPETGELIVYEAYHPATGQILVRDGKPVELGRIRIAGPDFRVEVPPPIGGDDPIDD